MRREKPSKVGQWLRVPEKVDQLWLGKTVRRGGILVGVCIRDYAGRMRPNEDYEDPLPTFDLDGNEYVISEEEAIRCLLAG